MKKLLVVLLMCMWAVSTFAQDSTKVEKTPLTGYVCYGLSMTNSSDFKTSSYTGIEGGVMKGNLGLGLVFGRGSLAGLGRSNDNIRNYFYEAKNDSIIPNW